MICGALWVAALVADRQGGKSNHARSSGFAGVLVRSCDAALRMRCGDACYRIRPRLWTPLPCHCAWPPRRYASSTCGLRGIAPAPRQFQAACSSNKRPDTAAHQLPDRSMRTSARDSVGSPADGDASSGFLAGSPSRQSPQCHSPSPRASSGIGGTTPLAHSSLFAAIIRGLRVSRKAVARGYTRRRWRLLRLLARIPCMQRTIRERLDIPPVPPLASPSAADRLLA